jgi:hypothetical protein
MLIKRQYFPVVIEQLATYLISETKMGLSLVLANVVLDVRISHWVD